MIALSVRGPWWWFILHAGKPVENRFWPSRYRAMQMGVLHRAGGGVLLHASAGCGKKEYEDACEDAAVCGVTEFPAFDSMYRGGFVGKMKLGDFVEKHDSPWFSGVGALTIHGQPEAIEFIPHKGELGFFTVQMPEPAVIPLSQARGATVTDYSLKRRERVVAKAARNAGQSELFPAA